MYKRQVGRLLFLDSNSKYFKALTIFVFGLSRPLFMLFELLGRRKKDIVVGLELKPVLNQLNQSPMRLNEFIVSHFLENEKTEDLLLRYLDGFPVLENCGYEESKL